jgi:hypothetical protein
MAAQAMLAVGGEVWVADETALREFPPLRASWSRRGEPAIVLISGKNPRRTIFGALNVRSGELVHTVREQCRTTMWWSPWRCWAPSGRRSPSC